MSVSISTPLEDRLNYISKQLNEMLIYENDFNEIVKQSFHQIYLFINQFKQNLPNHFISNQIENILHNYHSNDQTIPFRIQSLINSIEELSFNPTKEEECLSNEEIISYRIHLIKGQSYYPDLINSEKRIEIPLDQCLLLSRNDKSFIFIGKSFIYLYNQHLKFVRRKSFNQSKLIKDIHWSNTLQRFVLISSKDLFILDPKTMIIGCYPLNVPLKGTWCHLTCSEKCLYLSTYGINPFIVQFNLFPSILFKKKLKKEIRLNENHLINQMIFNENLIYLIIEDHLLNKSFIRIFNEKSFEMINEIFIGNGWNYQINMFYNRYLMILDQLNNSFIYLSKEGQIMKKEFYPTKAIQFISFVNYQIIVQTKSHFNIHQTQ